MSYQPSSLAETPVVPRHLPRYPVYVPSKGRWQEGLRLTTKALGRDGVPFRVVVEPQEADAYAEAVGEDKVLVLPFSNLGQGSIPARNWIRDHAEARGYDRHWVCDDNIFCTYRLWEGIRIPVHTGTSLRVCEDFTDRFENVAVSGLAYDLFVIPFGSSGIRSAYTRNAHVYSAVLMNNRAPFRWRGKYNEDVDLCLQALVSGWSTLLINALTVKKVTTMTMGGGNTSELYEGENGESRSDTMGRFEMARSLQQTWPGLARISRRYGRYQHSVDWARFANVPLRLRDDVDLASFPEVDEYGMVLRKVRPVRSGDVQRLLDEYEKTLASLSPSDPLWRGLPGFRPISPPPKLTLTFQTQEARDRLVEKLGVTVDKRYADKAWSARFPDRGRHDPASLRFEPV